MSRGHGSAQTAILEALSSGEAPANKLCWDLAEAEGAVDFSADVGAGIRSGSIRRSFYSAHLRAMKKLKESGAVASSFRQLEAGEIPTVYPYKTLSVEVRDLRKVVLPHLIAFGDGHNAFSVEAVEARLLEKISGTARYEECCRAWTSIEDQLWVLCQDPRKRAAFVPLLLSGTAYFGAYSTSASVHGSFRRHAGAARSLLGPGLLAEARALYQMAFEPSETERLAAKGRLFGAADFGRKQGKVELNEQAMEWLLEKIPDVVRALPGFVEPEVEDGWHIVTGWTFPPLLRGMMDRHVFGKFEFVSLPETTS